MEELLTSCIIFQPDKTCGELTLRCEVDNNGVRKYSFLKLKLDSGDEYHDVSPFHQWVYLANPDAFAQTVAGTQWKGLNYLRQAQLTCRDDAVLVWRIEVNYPYAVGWNQGIQIGVRKFTLQFHPVKSRPNTQETVRRNKRDPQRS